MARGKMLKTDFTSLLYHIGGTQEPAFSERQLAPGSEALSLSILEVSSCFVCDSNMQPEREKPYVAPEVVYT